MKINELIEILKRLYREYVRKFLNKIILALILSVFVAGSTSATAWLLDPAVKKIFLEQNTTLAWLIPLGIIVAFSTKGMSLYFARSIILKIGFKISGELQKNKSLIIYCYPIFKRWIIDTLENIFQTLHLMQLKFNSL